MLFDFSSKGWILQKWNEKETKVDCSIERKTTLDNRGFENVLETSVQNLNSEFSDLRIEVKYNRKIYGKSVEIKGRATNNGNMMFSVRMTTKRINVTIFDIEFEKVLNCIH